MAGDSQQGNTEAVRKQGSISKILSGLFSLVAWLLFALFINITVELVGIFFHWWELPGSAHSLYLLRQELGWINEAFYGVLGSPGEKALTLSDYVYQFLFVWFEIDWIKSLLQVDGINQFAAFIKAFVNTIQLFSIRFVIILFSLPVFFVFSMVAFVDGLMVRDLRRFGGDRESSYQWHYIIKSIKPLFIAPFVVYLGSPMAIHPNWAILPFVVSVAFAVWLSTAKFKKYL